MCGRAGRLEWHSRSYRGVAVEVGVFVELLRCSPEGHGKGRWQFVQGSGVVTAAAYSMLRQLRSPLPAATRAQKKGGDLVRGGWS